MFPHTSTMPHSHRRSFISIDFPSIRLNLTLPPAVKSKKGAIRAMWLSFDHYSDYCPSYRIPYEPRHNMDILRASKREWKKRRELEQLARSKMPPKPSSRHSSNDLVVPFDAFELTQSPLVDVDQLYMEHIANRMRAVRQAQGAGAMNRKEFEMNMRHFRIIGGIFCLDYFEQPEQCVKLASNMYLKTGKNDKLRNDCFFWTID